MGEVFVFLGTYLTEADARADYEVLKELHRAGTIGSYDAAILMKDAFGQIDIAKDELPTRHGAWTGAAVGAAVGAAAGLIFPPTVLVSGAVGAGAGALIGHFRRGLSNSDLRELGDALAVGDAGLVVVADSKLHEVLEQQLIRATATLEKGVADDPELTGALEESSRP